MRGRDPALTGQKLLGVACGLRARLGALLSGALVEAEMRKGSRGGGGGGGFSGGGGRETGGDQGRPSVNQDARRDEEEAALLQDLPPLLLMARRAWLDGGRLGGGRRADGRRRGGRAEGGSEGLGGQREPEQEGAPGVDWAKKAEDLSVDLAEFMLQSIG